MPAYVISELQIQDLLFLLSQAYSLPLDQHRVVDLDSDHGQSLDSENKIRLLHIFGVRKTFGVE